jgi:phosphate-selective porin OprO/OprP
LLWASGKAAGAQSLSAEPAAATSENSSQEEEKKPEPVSDPVTYGPRGLDVRSRDGNFHINVTFRAQLRYSYPFEEPPRHAEDASPAPVHDFAINRARLKVGGHAFRPWLKWYVEYDFVGSALLDFRMTLEAADGLNLRVGQWKAEFSRERIASSGEQQLVERTIVNREFTIDRQSGVEVFGRVGPGHLWDSTYWAGVFTGGGRGGSNDDEHPLWMLRYQWNFLGRELEFAESDLDGLEKPKAALAFATVSNRSRFTRFSSEGGGQIDGFEDGAPGQYEVDQQMGEFGLKWRGLFVKSEVHRKTIDDRLVDRETELEGAYVQAGYFFHYLWKEFPRPLELAARWAYVDPDTRAPDDRYEEMAAGANWFFRGHRNKLTGEVSRFTFDSPGGEIRSDMRLRIQWEVSF